MNIPLTAEEIEVYMAGVGSTFYDGPDDPIHRWTAQAQDDLNREIESAGGVEAWREQKRATSTV